MKKKLHQLRGRVQAARGRRGKGGNSKTTPRITNDTVAEHREEVLSSARKYIYPLQHSRHRIVIITLSIFIAVVLAFFTYTLLALYRFNTTSTFMYRVTQVVPFPIARAGSNIVAYENYLFDLRRYMHYYETQQEVDFSTDAGKDQLEEYRKRALDRVINDAFVKQLAEENNVTISRAEVDQQIELMRVQNKLGDEQALRRSLQQFWNWSIEDFRRHLRQELLAQKVASTLDTETHTEAQRVLERLQEGDEFAELAKEFSDDISTKDVGGDYGIDVQRDNPDIQPQVIEALFSLEEGQVSDVIETALGLEIVKVLEKKEDSVRAAHIIFAFEDITTYVDQQKEQETVWRFVRL